MSEKQNFRKEALAIRRALSQEDRNGFSLEIVKSFRELDEYKSAKGIFLYMSYADEVSTTELAGNCISDGKRIAFPVCVSESEMEFKEVSSLSELKSGFKGILEPDRDKENAAFIPDIIIVPGVAFDRGLSRMGYGRGYYDRYLSALPEFVLKAGLSFSIQVFDKIPSGKHDKRLDMIVTEKEIIR
ncbi:MAG: 5-formyltetrahydrofolate cyclo-ligase [Lachnospiraceae bacterium]|nr:5-formyltetrahydrofolate cyclo-ligase [Lachnospiraceae bacterium]